MKIRFEDYFVHRIKQLTYKFPQDAVCAHSEDPFWSAPKRFPRPLEFSVYNGRHLRFVMAASILRAKSFRIPIPGWVNFSDMLAEAVGQVIVPDFVPKEDPRVFYQDITVINDLAVKLEACREKLHAGFKMQPIQFGKNDDSNYQMDLVAGLTNTRARNYNIPQVDKLKAKLISGRTIPAITTSTAMATGLVCLELYKVLAQGHRVEDYRNTFSNLALPLFTMAEPAQPKVSKHGDMKWTVWDRWVIEGNPTPKELLRWLKEHKGLNAVYISFGKCMLCWLYPESNHRLDKKIVDLVRDVAKVELPSYKRHFDVVVFCEDDEENDVEIPRVSVFFK